MKADVADDFDNSQRLGLPSRNRQSTTSRGFAHMDLHMLTIVAPGDWLLPAAYINLPLAVFTQEQPINRTGIG